MTRPAILEAEQTLQIARALLDNPAAPPWARALAERRLAEANCRLG